MKRIKFNYYQYIGILTFLILFFSTNACFAAKTPAAGMILDSRGEAKITLNNQTKNAYIMAPILDGSTVTTGKNGSIIFARYSDGKEYKIGPNSTVIFKGKTISPKKGKIIASSAKSGIPLPRRTAVASRKIMGEIVPMIAEEAVMISMPAFNEILESLDFPIKWTGGSAKEYEIVITSKNSVIIKKPFPIIIKNTGSYDFKNDQKQPGRLEYGKEYILKIRNIDTKKDVGSVNFKIISPTSASSVKSARKTFNDIVKKAPDDTRVYLLMADYYKENGLYRQAIPLLEEIIKKDPKNPYPYYYLGDLFEKIGNFSDSNNFYMRGNKLDSQ